MKDQRRIGISPSGGIVVEWMVKGWLRFAKIEFKGSHWTIKEFDVFGNQLTAYQSWEGK